MSSLNGSTRFYGDDGMPLRTYSQTVLNEPAGGYTSSFALATLGEELVRFGVSVLPQGDGSWVTWFVDQAPRGRTELDSTAFPADPNIARDWALGRAHALAVIWTAEHYRLDPVLAYELLCRDVAQHTALTTTKLNLITPIIRRASPLRDRQVSDLRDCFERLRVGVEQLKRLANSIMVEREPAQPPRIDRPGNSSASLASAARTFGELEADGYPAVTEVKAVTPEGTGPSLAFEFCLAAVPDVRFRVELSSPESPFSTMLRAGRDLWTTLDCADGVPDLKTALRRTLRVAAGWAGETRRIPAREAVSLQGDHVVDSLGMLAYGLDQIHELAGTRILEPPANFHWIKEACERLLLLLELLGQED